MHARAIKVMHVTCYQEWRKAGCEKKYFEPIFTQYRNYVMGIDNLWFTDRNGFDRTEYLSEGQATFRATIRSMDLQYRGIPVEPEGPPPAPLTRFLALFEERARDTDLLMEDVMREL